MDNLKLYEINASYITYLSAYAPHLFQNKKSGQKNERNISVSFYISTASIISRRFPRSRTSIG